MTHISPITADNTDASTQSILDTVKSKIGMVPNLIATFARSPVALNGYLGFSDAVGQGRLSASQREVIALAVAQLNGCHYCLSAHTMIAKSTGLNEAEILAARRGNSDSPLNSAIASFTVKIVNQRGVLSADELSEAREAGIDDDLMIEIVANVALNILTNYTNNLAETEIDFPKVAVDI